MREVKRVKRRGCFWEGGQVKSRSCIPYPARMLRLAAHWVDVYSRGQTERGRGGERIRLCKGKWSNSVARCETGRGVKAHGRSEVGWMDGRVLVSAAERRTLLARVDQY